MLPYATFDNRRNIKSIEYLCVNIEIEYEEQKSVISTRSIIAYRSKFIDISDVCRNEIEDESCLPQGSLFNLLRHLSLNILSLKSESQSLSLAGEPSLSQLPMFSQLYSKKGFQKYQKSIKSTVTQQTYTILMNFESCLCYLKHLLEKLSIYLTIYPEAIFTPQLIIYFSAKLRFSNEEKALYIPLVIYINPRATREGQVKAIKSKNSISFSSVQRCRENRLFWAQLRPLSQEKKSWRLIGHFQDCFTYKLGQKCYQISFAYRDFTNFQNYFVKTYLCYFRNNFSKLAQQGCLSLFRLIDSISPFLGC